MEKENISGMVYNVKIFIDRNVHKIQQSAGRVGHGKAAIDRILINAIKKLLKRDFLFQIKNSESATDNNSNSDNTIGNTNDDKHNHNNTNKHNNRMMNNIFMLELNSQLNELKEFETKHCDSLELDWTDFFEPNIDSQTESDSDIDNQDYVPKLQLTK